MAASNVTAAELRRAVFVRANELEEICRRLRGPISPHRQDLRDALEIAGQFPAALRHVTEYEWQRNPNPADRELVLQQLLRHAIYVADFIEEHLAHGTRRELSEALADEIRRELESLGLSNYRVVISHGQANNFVTKYGDFSHAVFGPFASTPGVVVPAVVKYAFFKMPRIEGAGVAWRPILLGHEVAHIGVYDFGSVETFDLQSKFDFAKAAGLPNPVGPVGSSALDIARGLYRIAEAWTTELLCDAHALYRYGPAAIASLGEYFLTIGAMDAMSKTHPPGLLRIRLLLDHLGSIPDSRLAEVAKPLEEFTPTTIKYKQDWANFLVEIFESNRAELWSAIESFPTDEYLYDGRVDIIHQLADRLGEGVPGDEVVQLPSGHLIAATDPDVINATWLARVEGNETPIDSLARKGIESLELMRRWTSNGGSVPLELYEQKPSAKKQVASGTLTQDAITVRLQSLGKERLVVRPLMQRPKGAAFDLRLGNRFIIFHRTSTASFDPLSIKDDPRMLQVYTELAWSEQFILHPHELVLGATLEYLVLPDDLTAQVVTRSSYGRLGLLSATAVQVHPNFHGCLTLELVNLSTLPLALTPGERIAQLVLTKTAEATPPGDEKYSYPTGPEFSRVRDDIEARVLRAMRGAQASP